MNAAGVGLHGTEAISFEWSNVYCDNDVFVTPIGLHPTGVVGGVFTTLGSGVTVVVLDVLTLSIFGFFVGSDKLAYSVQ